MNNNLLLFAILLFLLPVVNAQTYSYDFQNYQDDFLILDQTVSPTGFGIAFDALTPITGTPQFGLGALKVGVDVSKNVNHRSAINKTLDINANLTDYNATGKLYINFSTDNNTVIEAAIIRTGNDASNYYEYFTTSPTINGFVQGYQILSFDLNSSTNIGGVPLISDINFIRFDINHSSGAGDFNWTINNIWVEKTSNNSFNGEWVQEKSGNDFVGYSVPNWYQVFTSDVNHLLIDGFEDETDYTSSVNTVSISIGPETKVGSYWYGNQGVRIDWSDSSGVATYVKNGSSIDFSNLVGVESGNPTSGIMGVQVYTPDASDINFLRLKIDSGIGNQYTYDGRINSNFVADENVPIGLVDGNRVGVFFDMTNPSSTGGDINWMDIQNIRIQATILDTGSISYDQMILTNDSNTDFFLISDPGISIFDNNVISIANRSRIFISELDSIDISNLNLTINFDLNQIDTNWGTRAIFDYTDYQNFSSCYVHDLNIDHRLIGIEQTILGIRDFNETVSSFEYNTIQSIQCSIIGTNVIVYLNGIETTSFSLSSRLDGRIGLESIGGTSIVKNYSTILSEVTVSTTSSSPLDSITYESFFITYDEINGIFVIAFLLIFMLLVFGFFYSILKEDNRISIPVADPNSLIPLLFYFGIFALFILFITILSTKLYLLT